MVIKLNIQRFADADITIKTSVDTKGLEDGLKDIVDDIKKADVEVEPEIDTDDAEEKIDIVGKVFTKTLTKMFGGFGKILGDFAKGFSKYLLVGILSVLGVVMLIVGAFKNLLNNNEELSKQWEEIKGSLGSLFSQIGNALASVFLPLLQSVLNFLQKMLQYVGYILKAWFGIDIFAKKTDKSLAKGTKSAKEMNKQLAGFDEMNVLSDNKGTSGGGVGEAIGDTGASLLLEAEPPQWLKFIADNGEYIKNLILDIGTAIGLVMVILNASNPVGWIMLIIGAIGLLISYWDEIVAFCKKIPQWLYDNVIKPIGDFFTNEGKKFVDALKQVGEWVKSLFVGVWNSVKTSAKALWDGLINGGKNAWNGIKKAFSGVVSFFTNLWNKVKSVMKSFATKIGDTISSVIKSAINSLLKTAENVLNTPIKAINKLLDTINAIPGVNMKPLKEFKLPRLAKGGIINLPGKGVMVGNAIGGERSQEGVIPLTDSQQMALLGEAIGKYITINANITNTMNGRVISRELQKINGESDFAFNR